MYTRDGDSFSLFLLNHVAHMLFRATTSPLVTRVSGATYVGSDTYEEATTVWNDAVDDHSIEMLYK